MEEMILDYRNLYQLLEEENMHASLCFRGEILHQYRAVLEIEKEAINKQLLKSGNG